MGEFRVTGNCWWSGEEKKKVQNSKQFWSRMNALENVPDIRESDSTKIEKSKLNG